MYTFVMHEKKHIPPPPRFGEEHPRWKGGRYIDPYGYVYILVDGKYVREHRYVMEKFLGRPLRPEEVIHHKNGNRQDNRLENLQLYSEAKGHVKYHRDEEMKAIGQMELFGICTVWTQKRLF